MVQFARSSLAPFAATLLALAAPVAPAFAGSDNTLFIEQFAVAGGAGNSLFVDQSQASGSLVAGDPTGLTPATQLGDGNEAVITLVGDGGAVQLHQNNTGPGYSGGLSNTATITGGALASILLNQKGSGNSGRLDIGSGGNTGELSQIGDGNVGSVTVTGTDSFGRLNQEGNGNSYSLQVDGAGTAVVWNQIGNGLSAASGVLPAQVISNAGRVTITQISR